MEQEKSVRDLSRLIDLRSIEQFLTHEAHLLDERRFEDWADLFTTDGFYWVPSRADQLDPLTHVSIMYDSGEAMRTRIARLRHPEIHSQTPYSRTTRTITNVYIEDVSEPPHECLVRSKFMFYEFRPSIPQGLERIFAGTYYHKLVDVGQTFKIALKKVVLANCEAVFEPIGVYF